MGGATRGLGRLGQYALVLWAAVSVNFALPHLAPGDPVEYLYAGDSVSLTPEQLDAIRAGYGLDAPLLEQYATFWADLARGDLGTSVRYNEPVTSVLAGHVGWTLVLVGLATLLAAVGGTLLGVWAAWRRGSRRDRASMVGVLMLDSMPTFWLGMMLIIAFSVQLGWFPSFGAAPIGGSGLDWLGEVAQRLVLPVLTLALGMAGRFFLLARASMIAVLDEPYVRFARTKGISEGRIAVRHAFRTALLPVYTRLTIEVGAVLSGAVVVETVFAYPGLGQLTYEAVIARDYPLLQGAFLAATLAVVGANILADLTYPLLDPRVRRGAARGATEQRQPTAVEVAA